MNMVFIYIDCYLYFFFYVCEKIEDKKNYKLIDKVLKNCWIIFENICQLIGMFK